MAIKRSFSVKNQKFCCCLTCGAQIAPDGLKDNTVYTCAQCGQKMTVDRYESRVVLTVIERQDLRRRIPPEIRFDFLFGGYAETQEKTTRRETTHF